MEDALDATISLMNQDRFGEYVAYNLAAISFSPKEIAAAIQKYIPDFRMGYKADVRQNIADSWPRSIDDSEARKDWNWKHQFDLDKMVKTMLDGLHYVLR
jgi:nucleoside-diphosphate-sugar epimerase